MTIAEISTHLRVSERTIRRDISKLQSLDIPVEVSAGRNGGVRLESGSLFHALRFTDDEVLALSFGLALVQQSSNVIPVSVIEGALRRLASVTTHRLHQRLSVLRDALDINAIHQPFLNHQLASSLILDIAEAIKEAKISRLSYRSSKDALTTRLINPYGLVFLKPHWYLAGYCHLREDIRTFRLDRIRQAEVCNETFVKPADFDTLKVVSKSIAQGATGDIYNEVKLDASIEEASRFIPPTAALLEPANDGVLLKIHCRTDQLSQIALHLLGLPLNLEICEPQALRDALLEVSHKAQLLSDSTST